MFQATCEEMRGGREHPFNFSSSFIVPHLCFVYVSAVESKYYEHTTEGHLQRDAQQPSESQLLPPRGWWAFNSPQGH